MTTTAPTAVSSARTVPRWRTAVFWVLMLVLLFLHLGERPEQLTWVVTSFGGGHDGHEIHTFALSLVAWAVVAAVAANLKDTARQIGAAWVYGLISVVAFAMFLALADVPPEMESVLVAVLAVGALSFVAHPSPLRDRLRPTGPASRRLLGMLAVAAIPMVLYGAGQLAIHAASGPHDDHFTRGHWIVMAVYAFTVLPIALVAAIKVSGWRVPAWVAGTMVAGLGVASLGISAVSQLATPWALAAIVWGVGFVVIAEREARRSAPVA